MGMGSPEKLPSRGQGSTGFNLQSERPVAHRPAGQVQEATGASGAKRPGLRVLALPLGRRVLSPFGVGGLGARLRTRISALRPKSASPGAARSVGNGGGRGSSVGWVGLGTEGVVIYIYI